jgi:hypothetical protein
MERGHLDAADRALLVLMAASILGGGAALYFWLFDSLPCGSIETALTNVATAGSIITGLSLTGLSALSLVGGKLDALRERFGDHLRAWFITTFSAVATAVLACAVLTAVPATIAARIAVSLTPPLLLVILIASAIVVTSLYALEGKAPKGPRPVPPPK